MKYLLENKEICRAIINYVAEKNYIEPGTPVSIQLKAETLDDDNVVFSAILSIKEEE